MRSFGKKLIFPIFSLSNAPGFAVEKVIKISPEPFEPKPPTREIPTGTLLANLFNWLGRKGASVATITIIDPRPSCFSPKVIFGRKSLISLPTGTPAIVNSFLFPQFAWTNTPIVYSFPFNTIFLDDVPIPPLNP